MFTIVIKTGAADQEHYQGLKLLRICRDLGIKELTNANFHFSEARVRVTEKEILEAGIAEHFEKTDMVTCRGPSLFDTETPYIKGEIKGTPERYLQKSLLHLHEISSKRAIAMYKVDRAKKALEHASAEMRGAAIKWL